MQHRNSLCVVFLRRRTKQINCGYGDRSNGFSCLARSWSEIWYFQCVSWIISFLINNRIGFPNSSHLITRIWLYRQNKIRGGEEILDIFDYVEDTKGNPNERGRLLVTNLRLIWYSLNNNKFNLCTFDICITWDFQKHLH